MVPLPLKLQVRTIIRTLVHRGLLNPSLGNNQVVHIVIHPVIFRILLWRPGCFQEEYEIIRIHVFRYSVRTTDFGPLALLHISADNILISAIVKCCQNEIPGVRSGRIFDVVRYVNNISCFQ